MKAEMEMFLDWDVFDDLCCEPAGNTRMLEQVRVQRSYYEWVPAIFVPHNADEPWLQAIIDRRLADGSLVEVDPEGSPGRRFRRPTTH